MIAARVVPAVADALYGCFTAHTLAAGAAPNALREACSRAVEAAVVPLISADAARVLVAALWGDRREGLT